MRILNWLKQTPLWLVVPSVLLAAGVATAVTHHEPLVFDPSLYEVQTADAAELVTIDAGALEAANAADEPPVDVALDAPAAGTSANTSLADGTWTGYAPCGKGNADSWKPYYVGVTVNVSGGRPQGVTRVFGSSTGNTGDAPLNWDAAENQKYLDWATSGRNGAEGVQSQLAARSVVTGIDTVSGATYSSAAIFNAYVDALGKAAKAAGGSTAALPKTHAPTAKGTGKGKPRKAAKTSGSKAKASTSRLADGAWTAYAPCGPDPDSDWKPYYIGVKLTVKDGAPASIDKVFGSSKGEKGTKKLVYDAGENGQYLDAARYGVGGQLERATAKGKVLGSVDTVSGATFSSKSIHEAYLAALKKAAQAVGSSDVVPDEVADTTGDGADASVGTGADNASGDGEGAASTGEAAVPDGSESFYGFAYCSSSSSDSWAPYYVFVQVSAADGRVAGVARVYGDADGIVDPSVLYSSSENSLYLNWAIEGKFGGVGYRMKSVVVQIQEKIEAGAEVSGISTVSGATRSSNAIKEAYEMAVANAAAGVGRTPEEAVAAHAVLSDATADSGSPLVPGTPAL